MPSAGKLGKFVQEQHPHMGQGDLAGPGLDTAADQRRQRGRMVRVAKRPLTQQSAAFQRAGYGVDHRDFECLGWRQGWQNAGQALGQHRLARPRRADHQEVMGTGGGDLEGALGGLLALDIHQVKG
jgi:hypothetical protein